MEDTKFETICRICLENGATIPIFETNNKIESKLTTCLNEKVDDVSGYPRNICFTCDDTLDMICNFIDKYKESLKVLKTLLPAIKTESHTPEIEIDASEDFLEFDNLKTEPDEEQKCLVEIIKPQITNLEGKDEKTGRTGRQKKKRKEKEKNTTEPSIVEGDFSWTGQKCYKIGDTTIVKRKPKENKPEKEKRTAKKVPKELVPKHIEKLCDLCGEVFPTQEKLSTHQRVVHFKNPAKCEMCSKTLVNEYYLNRHILRRHSQKPKEFTCPTCNREFAFKGELRSHIQKVHNKHLVPKKTYSCKICNKEYKCPKSVIVHERSVHTGQRPAECGVCGARFYHIDYLKEHMRLHTGETPFKCPICGRGYAQRCNMKSHLRIHRMSELDAATLSKLRPNYIRLLKENRNR